MHRLSTDRAGQILSRARSTRVLVLGDVMLDVYLRGPAGRISPEAPVPVVRVEEEWHSLGGAANVAANVVALGAGCDLVGCLGTDRAATDLGAALELQGIATTGLIRTADRPTTTKTRVLARHHQVARYDRETDADIDDVLAAEVVARVASLLGNADALVIEDYNKGLLTLPVIRGALDAAARAGVPAIVDPKSRHFYDFRGAAVFKPNHPELSAAVRGPVHADDVAWLEDVRTNLGCANLLVTLGEDGMALLTEDGEHLRVPTVARAVFDVSGAGDTVTAVLGAALAAGATVAEAAILSNYAAGVEVGKAGVATVMPEEILAAIDEQYSRLR